MAKEKFSTKKFIFIAVIVIACVAAGMAVAVFFWHMNIVEIREIPMSFAVEDIGAFNVDTDEIYFGSAPRGNSAGRSIHIESDEELLVTVMASGNISEVLVIPENNFYVGPDNRKTLDLAVYAPNDAEYITRYEGTLRLVFRRV